MRSFDGRTEGCFPCFGRTLEKKRVQVQRAVFEDAKLAYDRGSTATEAGRQMSIAMRPRLELTVGLGTEQVIARLREEAAAPTCICRVEVFYGDQVEVRIKRDHRHTWSPQVVLALEEQDGATRLRGKFGPDGQIWTMFMAGYASAGMLALGGCLVLSSQMMLEGQARWGAWLIAVGGALAILVYLLARVGQQLANPQMEHIDALIHRALDVPT